MNTAKAVKVCKMIADDCQADVRKWEHKPLSGQNVSEMHGESLAMIATLAEIVGALLEALEDKSNG